MPIWGYNASGAVVATLDTGYPAPAATLEALRANTGDVVRFVDVPPLTPEFYDFPDGADGAVAKPAIEASITKAEVVADERDAAVLKGVPAGATVTVMGPQSGSFPADGKDVHLAFAEPGTHEIRVDMPGHRFRSFKVNSVEPVEGKLSRRPRGRLTATEVVVGLPGGHFAEAVTPDVDRHFDALTAPLAPTAAMLGEAKAFLAGEGSDRIAMLAEAQGTPPELVAQSIVATADRLWAHEADRARVKRAIADLVASGGRRRDIKAVLDQHGIAVMPRQGNVAAKAPAA